MHPIHLNHSSHKHTHNFCTPRRCFFIFGFGYLFFPPTHSIVHSLSFRIHLFLFYQTAEKTCKNQMPNHIEMFICSIFIFSLPLIWVWSFVVAIQQSVHRKNKHMNLYQTNFLACIFFSFGAFKWKNIRNSIQNPKGNFNSTYTLYIFYCFHRYTFRRDNSTIINCFSKPCGRINANNVRRGSTDRYLLSTPITRHPNQRKWKTKSI